ncbi:helix-turn-helix domain-containing protein [Streptomyces sp. AM 2-1-1]|uniref:helix-turn-helix domain-containing protein n=1 Tax=Streptomyces sp. AM 2-1-1 TaxID=3028709 RepID=UPI0023B91C6D|nr:helix-turn-helix domain-containing protein [Streptomyces sp. AM 2-1-1]WEH40786.1 helix-turn-helix domain-containing protein [Streptomyces sp. AM 2-1-1]
MAKARPVTDAERIRIRELHAEGKGRNVIAKELGRSGRTISEEAGKLGLSFAARAGQVAAATEVRQADLADRRAQLAELLQDDAERMRAQMWQPTTVWSFGGKDNTYEDHVFPEAPADVKRTLMAATATAIDRSLKLVPPKDESGVEEGLALITQLMSGLAAVYKAQQQDQEAGEGA